MANNNEDEYVINNFQVDYLSSSQSAEESSSIICDCPRWVKMEVVGKTLNLSVEKPVFGKQGGVINV